MASKAVTRSISSIQFYAAFFSMLCKLIHLSLIAFIIGIGFELSERTFVIFSVAVIYMKKAANPGQLYCTFKYAVVYAIKCCKPKRLKILYRKKFSTNF